MISAHVCLSFFLFVLCSQRVLDTQYYIYVCIYSRLYIYIYSGLQTRVQNYEGCTKKRHEEWKREYLLKGMKHLTGCRSHSNHYIHSPLGQRLFQIYSNFIYHVCTKNSFQFVKFMVYFRWCATSHLLFFLAYIACGNAPSLQP